MKDGPVCKVSRGSALVQLYVGEVSKGSFILFYIFFVNLSLDNYFFGRN